MKMFKVIVGIIACIVFAGCAVDVAQDKVDVGARVYVNSDSGGGLSLSLKSQAYTIPYKTSLRNLVIRSDVIAKVDVVKTEPQITKAGKGQYLQIAHLKIENLLKGRIKSDVIEVYSKQKNLPQQYQAHYEIYDKIIVFLKKEGGRYVTYNNHYGQFPIYDNRVQSWGVVKIDRRKIQKKKKDDDEQESPPNVAKKGVLYSKKEKNIENQMNLLRYPEYEDVKEKIVKILK